VQREVGQAVCARLGAYDDVPGDGIQGQRLGGFGARLKDLGLQNLAQLGHVRQERLGAVDRRASNQQLQRVVLPAHAQGRAAAASVAATARAHCKALGLP